MPNTARTSLVRALSIAGLVALLSAAFANAAGATQRFASPTGTGAAPCVVTAPCSLANALAAASPTVTDEIVLQTVPGNPAYLLPFADGGKKVFLHGDTTPGAARPLIQVNDPAPAVTLSAGSSLSTVDIVNSSGSGVALDSAATLVDRVTAVSPGGSGTGACVIRSGILRNSICVSQNAGDAGIQVPALGKATITLRNVTAIDTAAGGRGIRADNEGPASSAANGLNVSIINAIAQGGTGGHGIEAVAGKQPTTVSFTTVTIQAANVTSTFTSGAGVANISQKGGIYAFTPLFVNPAASDYRVKTGSQTIDLGITDAANNGPSDLDGNARAQGVSTDLGANEVAPMVVTTTTTTIPPPTTTTTVPTTPTTTHATTTPLPTTTPVGTTTTPHSDTVDPVFHKASLVPGGFAVNAPKHGSRSNVTYGASLHFTLSEAAHVKVSITRQTSGRRSGSHCVKATASNAKARSCKLYAAVASFVPKTKLGANTVKFSGMVHNKALKRGTYHLTLIATDAAGNHSKHLTLAFKIVRG